MKKVLAFFLAVVLVISGTVFVSSAAKKRVTPVVIVSGYASTQLYDENGEQIWGTSLEAAGDQIGSDLPAFFYSLAGLGFGKTYEFGARLGYGVDIMLEKLKCTPAGTSKYNLKPISSKAAETNYKYLIEHDMGVNIGERPFTEQIVEKVGGENVFSFQVDFRRNSVDCAAALRKYIKDVKKYTGADKVSLFGLSHGGQTVGCYTALYGTEGDVDNVVMSVPALSGTELAVRALRGGVDLQIPELITFAELALGTGNNLARIVEGSAWNWADGIADGFFDGISEIVGYWGSLWDFVPVEYYDELKAELLDEKTDAGLIAKSDKYHYEIMPNYAKNFKKAQKAGVDISILCSYGYPVAFGNENNTDIIINSAGESGAKFAPRGKRFSDGYVQCGKNCKNKKHNHVSPSMEIDASYAYLPENTWFIDGQLHGMYIFEDYTLELIKTLLLTEKIDNIYSDSEHPQFGVTQNSYWGVFAKFDNSQQGFVSAKDKTLVVKNISEKYKMKLTSITCDGMDLSFSVKGIKALEPGEQIEIPFSGKLPAVSKKYASVTVSFLQLGSPTPARTRTFDYTIMNGKAVKFDSKNLYTKATFDTNLQKNTSDCVWPLIERTGSRSTLEVISNAIAAAR